MVQERKVFEDGLAVQLLALAQSVEVDHHELRAVELIHPDEKIARMEIIMEEAAVVKPGRQRAQGFRELPAESALLRRGKQRQAVLQEIVQLDGRRDRQGDQVVVQQEPAVPAL